MAGTGGAFGHNDRPDGTGWSREDADDPLTSSQSVEFDGPAVYERFAFGPLLEIGVLGGQFALERPKLEGTADPPWPLLPGRSASQSSRRRAIFAACRAGRSRRPENSLARRTMPSSPGGAPVSLDHHATGPS
jgi:hypothetical protein